VVVLAVLPQKDQEPLERHLYLDQDQLLLKVAVAVVVLLLLD
jgi:hypothetical protein